MEDYIERLKNFNLSDALIFFYFSLFFSFLKLENVVGNI